MILTFFLFVSFNSIYCGVLLPIIALRSTYFMYVFCLYFSYPFFSFPILKSPIPMLLPIFMNKNGFIIHLNFLDFRYLNVFIFCSSSLSIAISFVSCPFLSFYILLFLVFLHLSLGSFCMGSFYTFFTFHQFLPRSSATNAVRFICQNILMIIIKYII